MSAPRSQIDIDHEVRLADEHYRREREQVRADRLNDFSSEGFYDPELSERLSELASKRETRQ